MQDMLIYYGWLNAFNSAQNSWDNEAVSQELKDYDVLVLGAGLEDPGHGDYANTQAIITRVKELNTGIKIFGYVTANQPEPDFDAKVEKWEDLSVDGIFMDEAGYDYGKTRDELNDRIAFVHSQDKATLCFVNAWNPHHVLSKEDDPSYPNSTYNANDNNSLLSEDDWYLMESLLVNTDSYSPDGLGTIQDMRDRKTNLDAAIAARGKGICVAACGIISDDDTQGQAKFNMLYSAASIVGAGVVGSSDTSYGASSSKSKKWVRPTV